jgi:hypothetical protein
VLRGDGTGNGLRALSDDVVQTRRQPVEYQGSSLLDLRPLQRRDGGREFFDSQG